MVRARRLTGGVSTSSHLLVLRSGREVVLRRHSPRTLEEEPGIVAGEAAALAHVSGHGLPTPDVLAVDADGSATGARPAMVMGRLPGRIELAPRDPNSWLQQLAHALARVHSLPPVVAGVPAEPLWFASHELPPWTAHPERWAEAIAIVAAEPPPSTPSVFTHGDFQHFNLLWSRGRLTGIVDWNAPSARPPDADIGHCRLNLVILYGTEVADDFLRRYERESGGRAVDPWWDLRETVVFLPSWSSTIVRQVGSRIPVDADAIHRRVDAHLPTLLRRLAG